MVNTFLLENRTCIAEGIPAPNVTWGRANGKPLPLDRTKSIRTSLTSMVNKQTLHLFNLTKEDRGSYRCSADNSVRPPDDLFAKVDIQFAPRVSTVEPSYGSETGEYSTIMIWCKVDGNPRPAMTWYAMTPEDSTKYANGQLELDDKFFANAQAILTDNKYSVEQKIMTVGSLSTMESMFYSLTLLTVEPIDMGYYVCRAENTHGKAATAVQLYRVNTFAAQRNGVAHLLSPQTSILVLVCLGMFIY